MAISGLINGIALFLGLFLLIPGLLLAYFGWWVHEAMIALTGFIGGCIVGLLVALVIELGVGLGGLSFLFIPFVGFGGAGAALVLERAVVIFIGFIIGNIIGSLITVGALVAEGGSAGFLQPIPLLLGLLVAYLWWRNHKRGVIVYTSFFGAAGTSIGYLLLSHDWYSLLNGKIAGAGFLFVLITGMAVQSGAISVNLNSMLQRLHRRLEERSEPGDTTTHATHQVEDEDSSLQATISRSYLSVTPAVTWRYRGVEYVLYVVNALLERTQEVRMSMYCTNCGEQIGETRPRCQHCSKILRPPGAVTVADNVELAPLSARIVAQLIDLFILLIVFGVIWILVTMRVFLGGITAGDAYVNAIMLMWGGIVVGYLVLLEGYWDGQTAGKWMFDLRVVDARSGEPIERDRSILRNIFRPIDYLPLWYLLGLAAVLISGKKQRIGDHVAKTFVIEDPTEKQNFEKLIEVFGRLEELAP
jgi:uncharacterized RDD family membrane protein YckC